MSDVASVCSAPIVGEVRARGLDPVALSTGLDVPLADLESHHRRIPWRQFVVFAERASKMLGEETLEELAADATLSYFPRPIRRVLPRLRDSRPLFRVAARWWGPWVFHGTHGECEELPDGRLREVVRILPSHAPCPAFLCGIRGTLRAMPRLLGQPEALVTFEQDGREAEYIITPPPRRSRSRRKSGADALPRLEGILARGIAAGGEALLRDIVRLVQEQRGVAGVRLTRLHAGPPRETVSGSTAGAPAAVLPLQVAGRRVGRLELWPSREGSLPTLHDLAPWIALAVDYVHSRTLVARLTELLRDDVRDWHRVERRIAELVERRDPSAAGGPAPSRPADRDAVDLGVFVHIMASHLDALAGDDVHLEVSSADGLRLATAECDEFETLVASAVEILCDIGSDEIRIETRPAVEGGPTAAEVLLFGRGGELDAASRLRLDAVRSLGDAGPVVTLVEIEGEPDAIGLRLRLPLRGPSVSRPLH